MTAHHPDWREWLESLNAASAEYVVVGGVALAVVASGRNPLVRAT